MNDANNAIDAGDHRRLGRQLGLFATHPDVGAGLPLWLPNGAAIRSALERYVVEEERRAGYVHVVTPQLAKRSLYERSGHWEHYAEDMFPPMRLGEEGEDGEELVLRPMNCPHHALVYAMQTRGWRELPLRIAELGTLYRSERSGVLGGLSRARAFTLPDAHIFCAPEQASSELAAALAMTERAYEAMGISGHRYRLVPARPEHLRQVPPGRGVVAAGGGGAARRPGRACLRLRGGTRGCGLLRAEDRHPGVRPKGQGATLSTLQLTSCWPSASTSPTPAPTAGRTDRS